MAALSITDLTKVARRYYNPNYLQILREPNSPFFKEVEKHTKGGEMRAANIYADGQGRSAEFSVAQAQTAAAKREAFEVTDENCIEDHAVATITAKALRSDKLQGSFVRQWLEEADAKIRLMVDAAAADFWHPAGDGSRYVGVVDSVSSPNIVFTTDEPVRRLEVGDRLVASASATGALRTGGTTPMTVVSKDPSTKTVVVDAFVTGLAAADFIFYEGDAANAGSVKGSTGVLGWIPLATPSSTAWFGVNRAVSPTKLAGVREVGTSLGGIREAAGRLMRKIYEENRGLNISNLRGYVSPAKFEQLMIELEATGYNYRPDDRLGKFGFSSLKGMFGPVEIPIVMDPHKQDDNLHILDLSTWCVKSLGDLPAVADADGNMMLRQASASGYELRMEAYYQLVCKKPICNGVISLPA